MQIFLSEEVKRFSTPKKGAKIYATSENKTRKAGDLMGTVQKVDGNIVAFFDGESTDYLIWRFKDDEKNTWIEFGA